MRAISSTVAPFFFFGILSLAPPDNRPASFRAGAPSGGRYFLDLLSERQEQPERQEPQPQRVVRSRRWLAGYCELADYCKVDILGKFVNFGVQKTQIVRSRSRAKLVNLGTRINFEGTFLVCSFGGRRTATAGWRPLSAPRASARQSSVSLPPFLSAPGLRAPC